MVTGLICLQIKWITITPITLCLEKGENLLDEVKKGVLFSNLGLVTLQETASMR